MEKIKSFLKENGFTSIVVLGVAVAAFLLGKWLIFAACGGFFVGKNWEIIYRLWKKDYKDKVDNAIDKIRK